MTVGHVLAIVQAECVKLSTRLSARLGLVLAVLIGISMPLLLWMVNTDSAAVNGATLSESLDASAPRAALWALYLRNLWVMQAVVLLLVAQSLAGELQARTLREDLLRPVSRGAVLIAKFSAVGLFIALTLSLQYVVSSGMGLLLFGTDGPWLDVLLGYIATALGDLSFAAFAFAVTAMLRSVPATILVTMLFIVFEKLLAWALFIAGGILEGMQNMPPEMQVFAIPEAAYLLFDLQPGLPSSAWGMGNTLATGLEVGLITWSAAAFYFATGLLIALLRFARMDVP